LLQEIGDESEHGIEFLSILTAIRHLPGTCSRLARSAGRARSREGSGQAASGVADLGVTGSARTPTAHRQPSERAWRDAHSFDGLDALLSAQAYRLAYWRVAGEEINYRRFFDINELAAIRMEDPAIFERTHAYAFDLLHRGCIDGFRIDHVDGLFDPGDYLTRLRGALPVRRGRTSTPTHRRPTSWWRRSSAGRIAAGMAGGRDHRLRLPGHGQRLFIDGANERAVTSVYEQFTRLRDPYREIVYRGKRLVLGVSMASELNVLGHRLNRFSERHDTTATSRSTA
jgi:(1->4)-alpha-D-glucan 1-alpha-D-glucosylmutase